MKWVEVDSTNVTAIGYDPVKCELGIRFRASGKTYFYLDVPPSEYQAFVTSKSKGKYLNQVFKRKGYKYRESAGDFPQPKSCDIQPCAIPTTHSIIAQAKEVNSPTGTRTLRARNRSASPLLSGS
jgi:hypothetical protein